MRAFKYLRVVDETAALKAAGESETKIIAGGTLLVDLMKLGVEDPVALVDMNDVPLGKIEKTPEGIKIGAMARNTDVAMHALVRDGFPVLAEAILAGASAQLRNMATTGGNLMQRTRCTYFRDIANGACNKRKPGSGCAAVQGWSRMHAVLGTSDQCIAAHPSDMCVALAALDATVHVRSPKGIRQIPIADFHVVPGAHPELETALEHGEIITHVTLPDSPYAKRSRYVKVRDRASYAFALVSAAVALEIDGTSIKTARIALGGVATKPWRSKEAEALLQGKSATIATFTAAAEAAMKDAKTTKDNAYKVELGKRTIVRALSLASGVS